MESMEIQGLKMVLGEIKTIQYSILFYSLQTLSLWSISHENLWEGSRLKIKIIKFNRRINIE